MEILLKRKSEIDKLIQALEDVLSENDNEEPPIELIEVKSRLWKLKNDFRMLKREIKYRRGAQ
jgi:hypothetical protein